ncbi:ABC transporter permease [Pseudoglutamicibacter albus]|uniref:Peptide/nickel transport system permease protein n=1 Tax=Pseudoglutamicibacter albus TaxID=98671 RepID=A0ABU1YX08_9MICC|nr:ABC transporter permease [Pseudoglutamicibacter albus]MDR7292886.1 peptide/nickel transport system permease protein [Pseudoglutamicibacter albus]
MIRSLSQLALRMITTLLVASMILFVLLRVMPGDPAQVALGMQASPEDVAALRSEYGLDRPLAVQYLDWIGSFLTGNAGESAITGQNMTPIIADRFAVTMWLVVPSVALSLLAAVLFGVWSARRAGKFDAVLISLMTQGFMAVPAFLAGLLLVMLFSVSLGWLPASGWVVPNEGFGTFLSHLVLPVIALSLVQTAVLTRYVRTSMANVLRKDYIRSARARGLSKSAAIRRHGLRNAAIPVLTVAGLQLAAAVVGAVVIERVFDIPGLGAQLITSVEHRDMVTIQAIVMLLVTVTVVINALVDALLVAVDPRLRVKAVA